MKNKIFSKVGILLAAMVLINTALRAQNWLAPKSLTVHGAVTTNATFQKAKPLGLDTLISMGKDIGSNRYCFTLWKNGDTFGKMNLITSSNIEISDFAVFSDTIYFCGRRLVSQGTYVGIIGYFTTDMFNGAGNPTYRIANINNTSNLTKLIVCPKPSSHIIFVSAIGLYNNPTNGIQGRYVFLDHDYINNSTNYRVISAPTYTTNRELFQDICLTDFSVVTISRIYPGNELIVRVFDRTYPASNLVSNRFNLQNLSLFYTSDPYEYPVHITALNGDTIALSVGATDGPNDFTMVSKLYAQSQNIISNQLIYHFDKESKVLEMDYSRETNKLLLLTSNNFQGQGIKQTVNILNPDALQPYIAKIEAIQPPSELNQLCVLPSQRYALAGIYLGGSSVSYNLLSIKYIPTTLSQCIANYQTNINFTSTAQATAEPTFTMPVAVTASWNQNTFNTYTISWNTDCVE